MSQSMPYERRSMAGTSRGSQAPTLTDVVNEFSRANRMLMDSMNQMILDALDPGSTRERKPSRRHHEDECKDPCYHDQCHCRCCIVDADVAVYARVGELRLLSIQIRNIRRREREIKLELSGWSSHGGRQVPIKGSILTETQFTLAACEEKEILIAIDIREAGLGTAEDAKRQRLVDVDDCEVLYADLRVEGCSIRPVRIALALQPRDCDPYVIECGCACC